MEDFLICEQEAWFTLKKIAVLKLRHQILENVGSFLLKRLTKLGGSSGYLVLEPGNPTYNLFILT